MVGCLVVLVDNIAARMPTLQCLAEQDDEKVMEDALTTLTICQPAGPLARA